MCATRQKYSKQRKRLAYERQIDDLPMATGTEHVAWAAWRAPGRWPRMSAHVRGLTHYRAREKRRGKYGDTCPDVRGHARPRRSRSRLQAYAFVDADAVFTFFRSFGLQAWHCGLQVASEPLFGAGFFAAVVLAPHAPVLVEQIGRHAMAMSYATAFPTYAFTGEPRASSSSTA
jgi:hypothetical protein